MPSPIVHFVASLIFESNMVRPWRLLIVTPGGAEEALFYTRIEAMARLQGRLAETMKGKVTA